MVEYSITEEKLLETFNEARKHLDEQIENIQPWDHDLKEDVMTRAVEALCGSASEVKTNTTLGNYREFCEHVLAISKAYERANGQFYNKTFPDIYHSNK